jgi:Bacterial Ig-like domain (group 3)
VILDSSTLDPEGIASLKVTTLAVGTHIVTAGFPGNSTTAASASAALTVTVTAPAAAKIAATATPSRASTSVLGLGMAIERVVTAQAARETALTSGP